MCDVLNVAAMANSTKQTFNLTKRPYKMVLPIAPLEAYCLLEKLHDVAAGHVTRWLLTLSYDYFSDLWLWHSLEYICKGHLL